MQQHINGGPLYHLPLKFCIMYNHGIDCVVLPLESSSFCYAHTEANNRVFKI